MNYTIKLHSLNSGGEVEWSEEFAAINRRAARMMTTKWIRANVASCDFERIDKEVYAGLEIWYLI